MKTIICASLNGRPVYLRKDKKGVYHLRISGINRGRFEMFGDAIQAIETQIENIIAELETRIAADCKIVDREAAFNECLDAEGEVNVAGLTFMPSQIWREMDPTAHRCGVNDYADGQDWVEVRGETYQQDDAEAIKTDLTDDLDSQKTDLEGELDAEENPDEGETVNAEEVARMKAEIEAIESQLAELEKHSF